PRSTGNAATRSRRLAIQGSRYTRAFRSMRATPDPVRRDQAIRDRCGHPSGTFVEFPIADVDRSIPELFEAQVDRFPDRVAVRTRAAAVTYAELNRLANRVAHTLLQGAGDPAAPLAALLEEETLVAVSLGALKAGVVQVPLVRDYPRARLAYMLD